MWSAALAIHNTTLTATSDQTEQRILDEAEVVLHIDGVWSVDADLHVRAVQAREAKHSGRQALLEYWPIETPADDPYRLYRQVRRGADVELFILDTRQYRSSNAEPDGPGKTMLGSAQRDWLLGGLARSTATWKLIATSVPLSNPKGGTTLVPGNDSWARAVDGTGFEAELRAIVQTILDRKIRNVVWLAADVHYAQANAYDPSGDGVPDFHEFICGPLSAIQGRPIPPNPAFRPTTLYSEGGFSNFGLVTVNGASLRLQIIDEAGVVRFERAFLAQR